MLFQRLPRVPKLPGPSPVPVVGALGNMYQVWKDPAMHLTRLHREHGDIFSIARESPLMVCGIGPEFNKQFLSDAKLFNALDGNNVDSISLEKRTSLSRLNNAVVAMNGRPHERLRRMIAPSLHKKAVPQYLEDMVTISRAAVDRWRPGETREIFADMRGITLRIAMKTLLGLDPESENVDRLGLIYKEFMTLNASIPNHLFPVDLPFTPYRALLRMAEQLEGFTVKTIEQKRRNGYEDQLDVLSLLMRARDEEDGSRLSEDELIGNAHVLFIIGHQTMTDVLTWTWFLVSQHPEFLHRLCEEVDSVLKGDAPTFQQIDQLKLLEYALKETLRLFAPTIFQLRLVTEPFDLGPYPIPARAMVAYSPYLTHRMPDLFPNPFRYWPERWETARPSAFEYLPFGQGAHACLGPQYAMSEMKVIMATVLQRYRLALSPAARVDRHFDATLCPKYGLPMIVLGAKDRFIHTRARGDVHEMVQLN